MTHHDVDVLLDAMTSPDPAVRDGWAYAELAEGILEGRFEKQYEFIRARAVEHLTRPQVQARTFAPLILTWLVEAGDLDRGAWVAASRWYVSERDTRGYAPDRGWLHAVAHGADYLAASVRAGIATPAETLDVLVSRMLADGDAWVDQEDARVAHALLAAMASDGGGTAWRAASRRLLDALDAYEHEVEHAESVSTGRPPMWLRNVTWTCAIVHAALIEQPVVDGEPVEFAGADDARRGFADVLARMLPFVMRVGR